MDVQISKEELDAHFKTVFKFHSLDIPFIQIPMKNRLPWMSAMAVSKFSA